MALPPYLLPRPPMLDDQATRDGFDRLHDRAITLAGAELSYDLDAPLWQFLCYLADRKNVLLHGSGNPDIAVFEPRKSDDVAAFGNRKAIYAAGDGIWPLYYAILDRERFPMTLINASARIELDDGTISEPHYFFSITDSALRQRPYHRGTIYLLPADSFERQPKIVSGGRTIHIPQWASPVPVRPLAHIPVGPEDFPFLEQMRGHDDEATFARARANPDGFPWLD